MRHVKSEFVYTSVGNQRPLYFSDGDKLISAQVVMTSGVFKGKIRVSHLPRPIIEACGQSHSDDVWQPLQLEHTSPRALHLAIEDIEGCVMLEVVREVE